MRTSQRALGHSGTNCFSEVALVGLTDAVYVEVQDLAILFLCKYPIGLFDLPLWEKFGLYPPIGSMLEPVQVSNLEKVIGREVLSVLEPICHADPSARVIANHLESLPDLTEEQLEAQAIEVDQEEIKRNGFIFWRAHSSILSSIEHPELGQYFRERLGKLEAWARQNGLYEHGAHSSGQSETDGQ